MIMIMIIIISSA